MRIAVDLMGGDAPPQHLFPAIIEALPQLPPKCFLAIIATENIVKQLASQVDILDEVLSSRVTFAVAMDYIRMDDDPLHAVRTKKQSSLALAVGLLADRKVDALISCGNTGAIIAFATLYLPLLPEISRPFLMVSLPTRKKPLSVLDVGGNITCKAKDLVQYAFQGAAYQRLVQKVQVPRVGLLNIGTESGKGPKERREAFAMLQDYNVVTRSHGQQPKLEFVGNVEGRDVFSGDIDVLVTDGFSGNILLKTAEGVARFILDEFAGSIQGDGKAGRLRKMFDYTEYPGAVVCGVDATLIKVHGNASYETLLISLLNVTKSWPRSE